MSWIAFRSTVRHFFRLVLAMSILVSVVAVIPSQALDYERVPMRNELMTVKEARDHMVALINRDRASHGLSAVVLDATACDAAQKHTDEMAQWSYLSHWDLLGRKPDERYSDAGGRGAVFENVYTNHRNPFMGQCSSLLNNRLLPRREIEQAEEWFFNQQAPYDRHRRNILDPYHSAVGIGLSVAVDKKWGLRITVAQEFVHTGAEVQSPQEIAPGQKKRISGRVKPGASLAGVQIYREGLPLPMSPNQLNYTGSYDLPVCAVASYPPTALGYASPVAVNKTKSNEEFTMELSADRTWPQGLYYILVWVRDQSTQQSYVGSVKTVRVTPGAGAPIDVAQSSVQKQAAAMLASRAALELSPLFE